MNDLTSLFRPKSWTDTELLEALATVAAGCTTRQKILTHVLTHGCCHRGAVGQVLRGVDIAPPRELYTRFLHTTEPQRCARAS